MRCTYFIIRILFVILILAAVINFLLVFNPFPVEETVKDREKQGVEGLNLENNVDILDEDSIDEEASSEEPNANEEIIGYSGSEFNRDLSKEENVQYDSINKSNEYFLTYEEIVSIENMSFSDKLFGLSVLRKIDKAGLEKILRIADGGITNEEWVMLNSIMKQYLKGKDIGRLKDVINKNKRMYEDNKLAKK